jgi:hypothetical protein
LRYRVRERRTRRFEALVELIGVKRLETQNARKLRPPRKHGLRIADLKFEISEEKRIQRPQS